MSFNEGLHFIKQFCCSPLCVGAVVPSSNALAEAIIGQISFDKTDVVVEYGSGTGVFTKKILEHLCLPKQTFIGFELDESLNSIISRRFPDVHIYKDSAANIRRYLAKHNLEKADAIISGLPWANFSEALQEEILSETIAALAPRGIFNTFAYLHGLILPSGQRFRKKLDKYFAEVKISPVIWKNFPPAIVYQCYAN